VSRAVHAAPGFEAASAARALSTAAVDAALAVLTIQHWRDVNRGIEELLRVARDRVVLVTMDVEVLGDMWLVRDYLPEVFTDHAGRFPTITRLLSLPPSASSQPIPIPHDCIDGFTAAFWAAPRRIRMRACAGSSPWQNRSMPT